MRSSKNRRQTIEKLKSFLESLDLIIDTTVVEGPRDEKALRRLGYKGNLITCSQVGVNDYDLMSLISVNFKRVLILTDFDQEGNALAQKFSTLLEREGVKVEKSLRSRIGAYTSSLGVFEIEDLDNMVSNIENEFR
jgi:5S rRNA maturation endonuclease (ribonuclease M5)